MSERRIAKLVDSRCDSLTYPPFLTEHGGVNSGFMLLQYTAAALSSENKPLSHPAGTASIPSSGNVEDHVSMGPNAALHGREIMKNLNAIVAIELFSAAQALDFRLQKEPDARMGEITRQAYAPHPHRGPFSRKILAVSSFRNVLVWCGGAICRTHPGFKLSLPDHPNPHRQSWCRNWGTNPPGLRCC